MPPAILFSVIGSIITRYVDARILVVIFSCVLILVSLEMLVPSFRFLTESGMAPPLCSRQRSRHSKPSRSPASRTRISSSGERSAAS